MGIFTIYCAEQGEHEKQFTQQHEAFRFVVDRKRNETISSCIWWVSGKAQLRVVLQDPAGAVVYDHINQPATSGFHVSHFCVTEGKYSLFVAPIAVPSPTWRFRVRVGTSVNLRRLPVLFLVDISKTMSASQIEHVRLSIDAMRMAMLNDPIALETAYLSCIAFDEHACLLNREFVELPTYETPILRQNSLADGNIATALYAASSYLSGEVRKNSPDQKGDLGPWVFLFSNCLCTKGWGTLPQSWACHFEKLVVLLPPGDASEERAKSLSEHVVCLDEVLGGDEYRKFIYDYVEEAQDAIGRTYFVRDH